jgi:hypothetical protein
MNDQNTELDLKISAVGRAEAIFLKALHRFQKQGGDEAAAAYDRAAAENNAAWDDLHASLADLSTDERDRLQTEIGIKLTERRKAAEAELETTLADSDRRP